MSPPKEWISTRLFGVGQSRILCTFFGSGSIPHAKMWCPRKLISLQNSKVFFGEQKRCTSCKAWSTKQMFCSCSAIIWDQMIISSRYTWQILPIRYLSMQLMCHWWTARAFQTPMSMTVHSCRPQGAYMASQWTSSGWTFISNLVMSSFTKISPLAQSCRISSMRGSGWLSGTVLAFSAQKSFTQCGNTVGSAFGMMNNGELWELLDGCRQPASIECQQGTYQWIRVSCPCHSAWDRHP